MGEWDLVRRLMEDEGQTLFWKVGYARAVRHFAVLEGHTLFGLPGNPVSSHVVFISIVAPWLAECMGATMNLPSLADRVTVKLSEISRSSEKPVREESELRSERTNYCHTHTHQGSGNIHSMVAHNGLTLLPPDTDGRAGETVDALWLR